MGGEVQTSFDVHIFRDRVFVGSQKSFAYGTCKASLRKNASKQSFLGVPSVGSTCRALPIMCKSGVLTRAGPICHEEVVVPFKNNPCTYIYSYTYIYIYIYTYIYI